LGFLRFADAGCLPNLASEAEETEEEAELEEEEEEGVWPGIAGPKSSESLSSSLLGAARFLELIVCCGYTCSCHGVDIAKEDKKCRVFSGIAYVGVSTWVYGLP
jgi:hypothetical protein